MEAGTIVGTKAETSIATEAGTSTAMETENNTAAETSSNSTKDTFSISKSEAGTVAESEDGIIATQEVDAMETDPLEAMRAELIRSMKSRSIRSAHVDQMESTEADSIAAAKVCLTAILEAVFNASTEAGPIMSANAKVTEEPRTLLETVPVIEVEPGLSTNAEPTTSKQIKSDPDGHKNAEPLPQVGLQTKLLFFVKFFFFFAVFQIRDISVWIRIHGSVPLTNGPGSSSMLLFSSVTFQKPTKNNFYTFISLLSTF